MPHFQLASAIGWHTGRSGCLMKDCLKKKKLVKFKGFVHLDALGLVSMMLCYVTVKTVVSIDRIRMLRTDCSGETRLAPHVPSSLSWKAF